MSERDFEKHPYTPNELRFVEYLLELTNGSIGAGDDPIGFLIASHNALVHERSLLKCHA